MILFLLLFIWSFFNTFINKKKQIFTGGSTSIYPVMNNLFTKYNQRKIKNNYQFSYNVFGDGGVFERVKRNTFYIGWLSRSLPDEEKNNFDSYPFATDEIKIIINIDKKYHKCLPESISKEELRKIYQNQNPNWDLLFENKEFKNELSDKKIFLYAREDNSATRYSFDKELGLSNGYYQFNITNSNGQMLRIPEWSMGYISTPDFYQNKLDKISENFKILDIKEGIKRDFIAITKKNFGQKENFVKSKIRKFWKWINEKNQQDIIENNYFLKPKKIILEPSTNKIDN